MEEVFSWRVEKNVVLLVIALHFSYITQNCTRVGRGKSGTVLRFFVNPTETAGTTDNGVPLTFTIPFVAKYERERAGGLQTGQ